MKELIILFCTLLGGFWIISLIWMIGFLIKELLEDMDKNGY